MNSGWAEDEEMMKKPIETNRNPLKPIESVKLVKPVRSLKPVMKPAVKPVVNPVKLQ